MKNIRLPFLLIIICVFVSCDLDVGSNYTPTVYMVQAPVKNSKDSVKVYLTPVVGVYRTDTIMVGDSLSFKVFAEGYTNNLTEFYITQSENQVTKLEYPDEDALDKIFTADSDYAKGEFLVEGKYQSMFFPFYYIALKPSLDAKVRITIVSDAKFDNFVGSNFKTIEIKTPIKEKR